MTVPHQLYDLNPVDRITAGAVGDPGQRVFYIQARKGLRLVTVLCEKEQIAALSLAVDQFLLSLAGDNAEAVVAPDPALDDGMDLEQPLAPVFRAGQVSLGYERASQRLVVIAYEVLEEGEETRRSVARFWATPAQMRAFSIHGQRVVAAGRPRCAMCGEPIDPAGHFCPRKNGDRKGV
jgi:uncharacterized repeat protein (TIGR03847 family)